MTRLTVVLKDVDEGLAVKAIIDATPTGETWELVPVTRAGVWTGEVQFETDCGDPRFADGLVTGIAVALASA
ncbi:MAG: hypothetical protein ACYC63_04685 [Armatimonadota bacterium]